MLHRRQGNCSHHFQGQRWDPHSHRSQRRKPTICTGYRNTHSGVKCGQFEGNRHSLPKCPAKDEYTITAKVKVTSVQFSEIEICQLLKKTTLQTQHFWTIYHMMTNGVEYTDLFMSGKKIIFKICRSHHNLIRNIGDPRWTRSIVTK